MLPLMKTKKCRSGLGTGQWEEGGRIQRSVAESHRSRAMAGKGSEGSKEVRGVSENSYVAVRTELLEKGPFKKFRRK